MELDWPRALLRDICKLCIYGTIFSCINDRKYKYCTPFHHLVTSYFCISTLSIFLPISPFCLYLYSPLRDKLFFSSIRLTWSLDPESHEGGNRQTVATCTAIFEGGHQPGRPLFGSRYCGGPDENLLVSWGVDGKLCMWYSNSRGNIYDPVAVLKDDTDYPIYALDISQSERNVVVGGGSGESGFIGTPIHLYNIPPVEAIQTEKEADSGPTSDSSEKDVKELTTATAKIVTDSSESESS